MLTGMGGGSSRGQRSRAGGLIAAAAVVWLAMDVAVAQDQSRPQSKAAARRAARSKGAAPADSQSTGSLGADDRAKDDQPEINRQAASYEPTADNNVPPPSTLSEVIEFARMSKTAVDQIKDYKAVFSKTELVRGRVVKQVMDMKFRTKPFSVYFRYRQGNEAGRQAIYVEGKFGNNLVVKEAKGLGAMAGRLYFKLDDPTVMSENRHPVTNVGIANVLNTALTVWDRESKIETAQVDVKFFPKAKLGDVPCDAVQLTYEKPHPELKFHMVRVYFDKDSKLPVKAERYGWPRSAAEKPPLVEDYTYTNVKINQRLTDADFDPATYGF